VVKANNATLCVQDRISEFFINTYPQTRGIVKPKNDMTPVKLLDELENGECDAVVMTSKGYESRGYESAGQYNKRYCDNIMMKWLCPRRHHDENYTGVPKVDLEKINPYELMNIARSINVDEAKLDMALNVLPDKTKLEDLIFDTLNHNQARYQQQLEARSISELLRVIDAQKSKLTDDTERQEVEDSVRDAMNSLYDTKYALMKIILTHGDIVAFYKCDETKELEPLIKAVLAEDSDIEEDKDQAGYEAIMTALNDLMRPTTTTCIEIEDLPRMNPLLEWRLRQRVYRGQYQ